MNFSITYTKFKHDWTETYRNMTKKQFFMDCIFFRNNIRKNLDFLHYWMCLILILETPSIIIIYNKLGVIKENLFSLQMAPSWRKSIGGKEKKTLLDCLFRQIT